MARIQAIYRYPVKGLSAEQFPRTALTTGETLSLAREGREVARVDATFLSMHAAAMAFG